MSERAIIAKRIVLFPPSVNGEVIALMVAFLLKYSHKKEVLFVRQGYAKTEKEDFLVGLDVSFMSGFLFVYNWALNKYGCYRYEDIESINEYLPKDIDLILVVYNGSDQRPDKVMSII